MRFVFDAKRLGDLHLHSKCKFVVLHPCGEVIVLRMQRRVSLVHALQKVKILALVLARDARRRSDVKNWRAFRAQRRSLQRRGQVSVGPICGATLGIREFWKHDVTWQVFVFAAQPVVDPSPDRRVSTKLVACVHVVIRRGMIDRIDLASAIEAKLIRDTSQVLPQVAHVRARLTGLPELERAFDVVTRATTHRGLFFAVTAEFLQMQIL